MARAPSHYIAQPLVELSSHATWTGVQFEPRRIDLRPFILYGDRVRVLPGGLTRVALRAGSYVVNSSQGGGSKEAVEDLHSPGAASARATRQCLFDGPLGIPVRNLLLERQTPAVAATTKETT